MATQIETDRDRRDYVPAHLRASTPAEDIRTILLNRVSWSAVFAGVVMALTVQLILNMFGVGIGAATIDPATGDSPSAVGFSIVAALWWTVSGIIAAYLGGFTAGRLAGEPRRSTAGWHGLTSWAFSTLAVFYILTSAFTSVISGTVHTAAATTPAIVQNQPGAEPLSTFEQRLREMTGTTAVDTPDTPQETAEAADTAADTVSRASLIGAIALLFGALAAWAGGRAGAVNPILTDRTGRREEYVH
jgi:hypothetical protein